MSTHQDIATPTLATEAIDWFVTLHNRDVSPDIQKDFADWLRRSPVHVEEFLQVTALHGDLARLPGLKNIDVPELLGDANSAQNVLLLDPLATMEERNSSYPRSAQRGESGVKGLRPKKLWLAAALALITVGLWSASFIRDLSQTERYRTAVGEQRSVTLADGSHVQLNVRSNLTVKVNETVRELRLDEGEALFQVAKDSAHPFRVHTPQATIEAIGTRFNVHVTNGATVVALIEGKVEVRPPRNATPITLKPGEQLTIASHTTKPPRPRAADLNSVTAWTERRLVFEDAPLSEVISEFNRYSRQPLSIADPTLGDVRITASFDSGSAQTFADSLATAGSLKVTRQPDGTWLIER